MGQIAVFAASDDRIGVDSEDTTRLILVQLAAQRDRLDAAEPVPTELSNSHESLKMAVGLYAEAASLLLPPEPNDDKFDFARYQELMIEGGKSFHGAGVALPASADSLGA